MSALVDLPLMRAMARDCGWTLAHFVDLYLRDAHEQLRKLRTATSPKERARIAHGLAGASATAGVTGMVTCLKAIEEGRGSLEEAERQLERVEAALRQAL